MARSALPQRRHAARGVTLVELVAMMLVIAVLAAVALPRYADAQGRARVARVKAAAASMEAVAALVRDSHAARAAHCEDRRDTRIEIDGTPLSLTHCAPQALPDFGDGILAAARIAPEGWVPTIEPGADTPTLWLEAAEATLPAACRVTYTTPSRGSGAPRVATVTTGC